MRSAEWEGQDFTDLIGHIASGLYCGVFDRRGRELLARSRPRLVLSCEHITNKRNYILATPPQPHVRKKLEPKRAAVFNLNG
jgi:hypothetical protein